MAGEILGYIECDGCGQTANIKKLKNSTLLYLHCKQCGMDRRSGATLQAKWQAAIDSPQSIDNPQGSPESQGGVEWSPSRETHTNKPVSNPEFIPASEDENFENPEPISGRSILTGATVLLAFIGMALKSIKR